MRGDRAIALVFGMAAQGCSGCGAQHQDVVEAGMDAFEPGPDVAADIDAFDAIDTGPSACAPDDAAASDWSCRVVDTGDGVWGRLSCAPSECSVRIALHPETFVPALQWVPCSSGRAGCRELVPLWVGDPANVFIVIAATGTVVGGVPYFWLDIRDQATTVETLALVPADGAGAAFALRDVGSNTTGCFPRWADQSSSSGSAAQVNILLQRYEGQQVIFGGPFTTSPLWLSSWSDIEDQSCGPDNVTALAVGRDFAAVTTEPGYFVRRIDRGSNRARVIATEDQINGHPLYPRIYGDDVYFVNDGQGIVHADEIWVVPNGAGPRQLIAHAGSDEYAFAVDDTTMAWLQGDAPDAQRDGGYYTAVSVWTASPATDPASVSARLVTHVPGATYAIDPAIGFGRYSFGSVNGGGRFVVNLVDGSYWQLAADPGYDWGPIAAWIGPDEIALDEALIPPAVGPTRLVRLRFDSLGPPFPAIP